jgi:hypothetical protein
VKHCQFYLYFLVLAVPQPIHLGQYWLQAQTHLRTKEDWHLTIIINQSSSRRRKMNTSGSHLDASIIYLDPYKNAQKGKLLKCGENQKTIQTNNLIS